MFLFCDYIQQSVIPCTFVLTHIVLFLSLLTWWCMSHLTRPFHQVHVFGMPEDVNI